MSELPEFTFEQVATHKTRDNIWFALNGKVYDVTKFLEEHPGGEEILLENAGSDATGAFEDVGHSNDAREMLHHYLKGSLKGAPKTEAPKAATEKSTKPPKQPAAPPKGTGGDATTALKFLVPLVVLAAIFYALR